MRGLNILSTVGATVLALGDLEWIPPFHQVFIKSADSVATATKTVTLGGVTLFSGPLPIEDGTDTALPWNKAQVMFTVGADRGRMAVTLGGTVAGCRTDIMIVAPGEPTPWGAINRFGRVGRRR